MGTWYDDSSVFIPHCHQTKGASLFTGGEMQLRNLFNIDQPSITYWPWQVLDPLEAA